MCFRDGCLHRGQHLGIEVQVHAVQYQRWPGGPEAAERKDRLFDARALGIALERLGKHGMV